MSYCISDYLNDKWINNKALKITNKDIIYAQINRNYSDNLELNLYLKFGNEERHVVSFQPVDFDLNCKWYEIDDVKKWNKWLFRRWWSRIWGDKLCQVINIVNNA